MGKRQLSGSKQMWFSSDNCSLLANELLLGASADMDELLLGGSISCSACRACTVCLRGRRSQVQGSTNGGRLVGYPSYPTRAWGSRRVACMQLGWDRTAAKERNTPSPKESRRSPPFVAPTALPAVMPTALPSTRLFLGGSAPTDFAVRRASLRRGRTLIVRVVEWGIPDRTRLRSVGW